MEVSTPAVRRTDSMEPLSARKGAGASERSGGYEVLRLVPSLSPPTATYGPRGEFPRPLLIAITYPLPTRSPFAGILPRDANASSDPDLPMAYRGRLAASFTRRLESHLVDAVR
jgi:hypothetical protein